MAARCIGAAPLAAPEAAEILAAQACHGRVAGIRQTLRWPPDPRLRWSQESLAEGPAWRRGVALLARHGFLLEILTNPWQAAAVADLPGDFPELPIVIEIWDCRLLPWQSGSASKASGPETSASGSRRVSPATRLSDAASSLIIQPREVWPASAVPLRGSLRLQNASRGSIGVGIGWCASMASAASRQRSSRNIAETTCTPVGTPSCRPVGTESPGRPSTETASMGRCACMMRSLVA